LFLGGAGFGWRLPTTISPSRPPLENSRQRNGNPPHYRPSMRSGKLTAEKKKPSETLTERFRELAVIQFQ